MRCPNDNTEMEQVKAESFYGQTVILDQCPECGGIWFDELELYAPKQGEADRIELLDVPSLTSPSALQSESLVCPRGHNSLIRFVDPFFPKDLILARCQTCNGYWLNRGEFSKYQQFRQVRKNSNKTIEAVIGDSKEKQELLAILQKHDSKDPTRALGELGRFLSTPLDNMTWQPLEPEKLSEKEKNAFNLIMTAISLIFRFFMRV
jgi:Zn-finger nucleic acid-binding protein